jgi:hypothetical protein
MAPVAGPPRKKAHFDRSIGSAELLIVLKSRSVQKLIEQQEMKNPIPHYSRSARAWYRAAISAAALLSGISAYSQTVNPTNITLGGTICSGGNLTNTVQLCLPPGSTVDKVDVFLLMDDTGSFQSFIPSITNIFSGLVANLEAALPGVEFGFGVGRFEDYGGAGNGFSTDNLQARPFILNQPIVTAVTAGSAGARTALINAALSHAAPGFGGDGPEAPIAEGLYQVATGLGFDGDGNGSKLDSGSAGALTTQTTPGNSGDVPPFSSNVLPASGTLGGAGFRSGALHLCILATDICPVAAFPNGQPIPSVITNAFGSSIPRTAFTCSTNLGSSRFGFVSDSKTKLGNTISNAVAPLGAGTVQGTVNALNALGIRVIGMGPSAAPTTNTAAATTPNTWLSAMARLTGAVDGNGVPLVFSTSGSLSNLSASIVNAVTNTATVPVDITLSATPSLPAGLGASFAPPVVLNVAPGGCASFTVTFIGGSPPPNGTFDLNFVAVGSGSVLGSIPVTVSCPVSTNHPPVAKCKDVLVSADPTNCLAAASIDDGSFDPDAGDTITQTQSPPGPYPLGTTAVTLTVLDTHGASSSCAGIVTVVDTMPPSISCPDSITATNDPGQCSASVTFAVSAFDCGGILDLSCDIPSGSIFPVGTTTVTCTAIDKANNTNTCSFTVTIVDGEAPLVACRPAPNPSDKKIPVAGKNPKSGQNPDGYYQLLAKDNCDGNPSIYVGDSASAFVAGPFKSGDVVKITQDPTGTPGQEPGPRFIVAHIWLNGDPLLYAVDAAGNVSAAVDCFVPPPPK